MEEDFSPIHHCALSLEAPHRDGGIRAALRPLASERKKKKLLRHPRHPKGIVGSRELCHLPR